LKKKLEEEGEEDDEHLLHYSVYPWDSKFGSTLLLLVVDSLATTMIHQGRRCS
jgi:hypothetical protein